MSQYDVHGWCYVTRRTWNVSAVGGRSHRALCALNRDGRTRHCVHSAVMKRNNELSNKAMGGQAERWTTRSVTCWRYRPTLYMLASYLVFTGWAITSLYRQLHFKIVTMYSHRLPFSIIHRNRQVLRSHTSLKWTAKIMMTGMRTKTIAYTTINSGQQ